MNELLNKDSSVEVFDQSNHNGLIEKLEDGLFACEQPECPVRNLFAPDVYMREITMPADSVIIGHEHKTEHFNIVLKGKARVVQDDKVEYIEAPCIFVSKAGVRKVLYIEEEMVWATVHPTKETDLEKIEKETICKSDTWLANTKELNNIRNKELL